MTAMSVPRVPTGTGRVHPFVLSKVVSEDPQNFTKNYMSAHTRVSFKAILFYIAAFGLFVLVLALLG